MPPRAKVPPSLMCSQRLWRLIRHWAADLKPPEQAATGHVLGPWAATVCREDERNPVLAIEVHTYLTIAFPLGDTATFHDAFAAALGAALEDCRIPPHRIAIEVPAVQGLSLGLVADTTLREALSTVDFVCGTELSYHTDLRVIQRNLNEFPHPLPPDYVPKDAVRRLFGVAGRVSAT